MDAVLAITYCHLHCNTNNNIYQTFTLRSDHLLNRGIFWPTQYKLLQETIKTKWKPAGFQTRLCPPRVPWDVQKKWGGNKNVGPQLSLLSDQGEGNLMFQFPSTQWHQHLSTTKIPEINVIRTKLEIQLHKTISKKRFAFLASTEDFLDVFTYYTTEDLQKGGTGRRRIVEQHSQRPHGFRLQVRHFHVLRYGTNII